MNDQPITPDAALSWLENADHVRPLSWTCAELNEAEARRCAATYEYALRMAESAGKAPTQAQLDDATRTLAAVGDGSEGAGLACYMPLLSASAAVCEAVITHPFLGAIVTGLLSRPVWPDGKATRRDGEYLQALALYAVLNERPIEDCCDLAGINPWIAGIVAPFGALAAFDVVTRQAPGLVADNAPVDADCVLAVAAVGLATEAHDLPAMTKRALFLWVAKHSTTLLAALSSLYDESDSELMLFNVLAEWAHASATGDLAPERAFTPALSVQAALERVQQFCGAAAGVAA